MLLLPLLLILRPLLRLLLRLLPHRAYCMSATFVFAQKRVKRVSCPTRPVEAPFDDTPTISRWAQLVLCHSPHNPGGNSRRWLDEVWRAACFSSTFFSLRKERSGCLCTVEGSLLNFNDCFTSYLKRLGSNTDRSEKLPRVQQFCSIKSWTFDRTVAVYSSKINANDFENKT